jgi:hypothetical protein
MLFKCEFPMIQFGGPALVACLAEGRSYIKLATSELWSQFECRAVKYETVSLRVVRWVAAFVVLSAVCAFYTGTIHFVDIAATSGLTIPNTYGGRTHKEYILETTGNGAAIFDYDGDGFNDIFIANGTTLDDGSRSTHAQLYRNDHNGHFTEVSAQAGLTRHGWAQGVCAGDYDNDGHPDLFATYYGYNSLYHNLGNGKFADVTRAAGLPTDGMRWGSGCTFLDYDRDGKLDIFVSNYVDLDLSRAPKPGENCMFLERHGSAVRKGLPTAPARSLSQQRRWHPPMCRRKRAFPPAAGMD